MFLAHKFLCDPHLRSNDHFTEYLSGDTTHSQHLFNRSDHVFFCAGEPVHSRMSGMVEAVTASSVNDDSEETGRLRYSPHSGI